jgi:hypothetical protein
VPELGILDMRFLEGFAFMARSSKWFQIRFPKQTASQFMSPLRKIPKSAYYRSPQLFFRV